MNPSLALPDLSAEPLPAFDMVLFGGTGDLAARKLLPALLAAHAAGVLPHDARILAVGRRALSRKRYLAQVAEALRAHAPSCPDAHVLEAFCQRLSYLRLPAGDTAGYARLAGRLSPETRVTVCYLATPPDQFADICAGLAAAGLNGRNVRVVLEKPLGRDLASSRAINAAVGEHFGEDQLYRIDHYLGKESVQNLMAIRFANVLFEPLWRREWIHHVEITIAETLGVEGRGAFYDRTGALRDMVQNHLLQLLCIVAMEPPASLDADAIRDEKLKVLQSLRPFASAEEVARHTVRGQYHAGAIDGEAVCAYTDEEAVPDASRTETFVALRAEIGNWRWAGVPFFLRTGKRLAARTAQIVINFRDVPHPLFAIPAVCPRANRLVIHLQPEESIRLYLHAKEPGDAMRLQPAYLNLDFYEMFRMRRADAYERLLLDVVRGRLSLFMRRDELEQAWRWVEPVLAAWEATDARPRPYVAGSWGPAAASALLSQEGVTWQEEC